MGRYFRFCIPLVLLFGVALAGAAEIGAGRAQTRAARRPNIIVVMTDDQTVENLRVMRRVRRLIQRQGTTFTNSYASFPLCCPSRTTFLTGRYSHNTGVVGNSERNGYSRFDQTNTLAVWLHRAGYRTAMIGKYLNEYGKSARPRHVPPGWDRWNAAVRVNYFRHSVLEHGRIVDYGTGKEDYSTDVYGRLALDAVRQMAPQRRPFFLWLSFFAPHDGAPRDRDDPPHLLTPSPAPRHRDRFRRAPLPRWPSLNERDISDKPDKVRRRRLLGPSGLRALREKYQQRLESLLSVDEAVGRLVEQLRRSGELDRTVIIFTSDNGFLEGQHRIVSGKEMVYEPSVRVPLLMRGPGIPRGRKLRQPVANVDLAPTIVSLAGATAGLQPDGRSLLPLLRDPTLEWGRDLLLERGPGKSPGGPRLYTAIHTPRYVYVEYANGEHELYDLRSDPDQLRNLYGSAVSSAVAPELSRRLSRLRECVGSFCRTPPALKLRSACEAGALRTRIAGADASDVDYVDYLLRGRRTRVTAPPFERLLTPGAAPAGARLRAEVVLDDGRRLSLDEIVRRC